MPEGMEDGFVSPWLARKDADWHIGSLYDFIFGQELKNENAENSINDAFILSFRKVSNCVTTSISRSVIDVNRDPTGQSLYPGMATTDLCPTTTFDGEPLYKPGKEPDASEIKRRRERYFDAYHAALDHLVERTRERYRRVVVFDCHSIRSRIPRLFDGELPHFNIGTNDGKSCDPTLTAAIEACIPKEYSRVTNGRFKGGYITRRLGKPQEGVHAIQMELAMRGYLREPIGPVDETNWPPPYDPEYAEPMRKVLKDVLKACLLFAYGPA